MYGSNFLNEFIQKFSQEAQISRMNVNFGSDALVIAAYIFMALGLYTLARNRGIKNPWLAWVPVANMWLLGCISDQYRYVVRGENRSRRKRMLTLAIVKVVLVSVLVTLLVVLLVSAGVMAISGSSLKTLLTLTPMTAAVLVAALAAVVVAIWLDVETFCAYYDLFSSCTPDQKTLYTVLSIVLSLIGLSVVAAVLVFICRNKEEGMPQRIAQPEYQ